MAKTPNMLGLLGFLFIQMLRWILSLTESNILSLQEKLDKHLIPESRIGASNLAGHDATDQKKITVGLTRTTYLWNCIQNSFQSELAANRNGASQLGREDRSQTRGRILQQLDLSRRSNLRKLPPCSNVAYIKEPYRRILQYCPTGMYCSGSICHSCGDYCKECFSSTSCDICQSGYQQGSGNSCTLIPLCTANQFDNGGTCVNCDPKCTTCTSATVCTGCVGGRVLQSGQCILSCAGGQIYNSATDQCVVCTANCQACASTTSCSTCNAGFFRTDSGHLCVQCTNNQYFDTSLGCVNCHSSCATCNGDASYDCTGCSGSAVLSSGTCVGCTGATYFSGGSCLPCGANCNTCTSGTVCTACAAGYQLTSAGACVQCSGSQYFTAASGCLDCQPTCQTCSGGAINQCNTCPGGRQLISGRCFVVCSTAGTILDQATDTCPVCTSNCNTCATTTTCGTCIGGYQLTSAGACVQCASNQYFTAASGCQNCDPLCLTCTGGAINNCASCVAARQLISGRCFVTCSTAGTFLDQTSDTCVSCGANCQTCASTTACGTCVTPYQPTSAGVCVQCTSSQYFTAASGCQNCHSLCLTCNGGLINNCLTCVAGRQLISGRCFVECPTAGTIVNQATDTCVSCGANCQTCSTTTACGTCVASYQLTTAGACVQCTSSQYFTAASGCQNCDPLCLTCSGGAINNCLTCVASRQLISSRCFVTCPTTGTILDQATDSCATCGPNCQTCATTTTCDTCLPGYLRRTDATACVMCTSSQYFDGSVCQPCDASCLTCTGPGITGCATCPAGKQLIPTTAPGRCFNLCAVNRWLDQTTDTCNPCTADCDVCGSATDCTTCSSGFTKTSLNKCLNCAANQYDDGLTCLNCNTPCYGCTSTPTTCTSCITGYDLVPELSKCYFRCPVAKYFDNLTLDTCSDCSTSCSDCSINNQDSSCATCKPMYQLSALGLNTATCIPYPLTCPDGHYRNSLGTCTPATATVPALTNLVHSRVIGVPLDPIRTGWYYAPTPSMTFLKCDCPRCESTAGVCRLCPPNHMYLGIVSLCHLRTPVTNYQTATPSVSSTSAIAGCINQKDTQCLDCGLGSYFEGTSCTPVCHTTHIVSSSTCTPNNEYCRARDNVGTCTACDEGYFLVFGTCTACHPACLICTGTLNSQCSKCAPGYHLINPTTCGLTPCNSSQVFNATTGACDAITDGCLRRSTPSGPCTQCADNFYLRESTGDCYRTCPIYGEYYDTTTLTCKPCDPSCATCMSFAASGCLSCRFGYVLSATPGTCTKETGSFTNCDLQTSRLGFSKCISAAPGFILNFTDEAMPYTGACPRGKYLSSANPPACTDCPTGCADCHGASPAQCSRCASGFTKHGIVCVPNTALTTCDLWKAKTWNSASSSCESCQDANCLVCPQKESCVTCKPGFYPVAGVCAACSPNALYCHQITGAVLSCRNGFYLNTVTGGCTRFCDPNQIMPTIGTCTDCDPKCLKCVGSTTNCRSCRPGDIRMDYPTEQGCSLAFNVTQGGYIAGTPAIPCTKPCLTCTGTAANCLTCMPGWFLNSSSACQRCNPKCAECGTSAGDCKACHLGFSLVGNDCQPVCEKYEYLDSTTKECLLCSPNCQTCDSSSPLGSACLSCFEGFYLNAGACTPCHESCATCSGPTETECTTCRADLMLAGGKCDLTCASGSFIRSTAQGLNCFACHKFCGECVGPSAMNCTSCTGTYTFTPNTFTTESTTPTGSCKLQTTATNTFYLGTIPNNWYPCHKDCATCSGFTEYDCLTCGAGYFQRGNRCYRCHPFCKECNGPSPYNCILCNAGYTLNTTEGFCYKDCPTPAYFVDKLVDQCVACFADCATCQGPNDGNCTSCLTAKPHLLNNASCVAGCASHYYLNFTVSDCRICHATCLECNDDGPNNCTTCPAAQFLQVDKSCNTECAPYSYQFNATTCAACGTGCLTCSGPLINNCLTCAPGLFMLVNSSCNQACPDGYFGNTTTMRCELCDPTCITCKNNSRDQCLTCPSTRHLITEGFCARNCVDGQYYFIPDDSCYGCHPSCRTCNGGSMFECTNCGEGRLRNHLGDCVTECPPQTYLNTTARTCTRCHVSCDACNGPSFRNCTKCPVGSVLLKSGVCALQCDPHQYADADSICQECHDSCKSCSGSTIDKCTGCFPSPVIFLTEENKCIDCLSDSKSDPKTCWFNVLPTMIKSSQKGINLKASGTIRITFPGESQFTERITPEMLKKNLAISVRGYDEKLYTYIIDKRQGEILLDMYFLSTSKDPVTVQLTPKENVVLTNARSGAAELIFANGTSTYEMIAIKSPDTQVVAALASSVNSAESVGGTMAIVGSSLGLIAMVAGTGIGAPLMKFIRVFKMVSRLRLINIFFGAYLELFLAVCGNLYKLGGDPINLQAIQASPNSRGKLDMYQITVLSSSAVAVQYAVYYIVLIARVYRGLLIRYVKKKADFGRFDFILEMLAEKGRVLLLTMVGIDIFFYSLRCVSHMARPGQFSSVDTSYSLGLSLVTLGVLFADMLLMLLDNSRTNFSNLRELFRKERVDLKKIESKSTQEEKTTGPAVVKPDQKFEKTDAIIGKYVVTTKGKMIKNKGKNSLISKVKIGNSKLESSQKQLHGTGEIPDSQTESQTVAEDTSRPVEPEAKFDQDMQNYFNKGANATKDDPSSEQFFGNGIKLYKLRTFEGRYYNSICLLKMFAFEPFYVTLQMIPTMQILALFLLQLTFTVWTADAGFRKKIFTSSVSFISNLANEISILIFLTVGVLFQTAGGQASFADSTRDKMQFAAIGCVALACVIGFVEFIASIIIAVIKTIRGRKLSKYRAEKNKLKEEKNLVRVRAVGEVSPSKPSRGEPKVAIVAEGQAGPTEDLGNSSDMKILENSQLPADHEGGKDLASGAKPGLRRRRLITGVPKRK